MYQFLVPAAIGAAQAIAGAIGANKTKNEIADQWANRPKYSEYKYTMPSGINSALNIYQQQASKNVLPGQERIEGKIDQAGANAINRGRDFASSSGELLSLTNQIYNNKLNALNDLAIQQANQKIGAERQLAGAYGQQAGYQSQLQQLQANEAEKAFNWNSAVPWQTRMNELQNKRQGQLDTMTSGISGLTFGASNFIGAGGLNGLGKSGNIIPTGNPNAGSVNPGADNSSVTSGNPMGIPSNSSYNYTWNQQQPTYTAPKY
jgi:hypothetical protein